MRIAFGILMKEQISFSDSLQSPNSSNIGELTTILKPSPGFDLSSNLLSQQSVLYPTNLIVICIKRSVRSLEATLTLILCSYSAVRYSVELLLIVHVAGSGNNHKIIAYFVV